MGRLQLLTFGDWLRMRPGERPPPSKPTHVRFTGNEDRARNAIIAEMTTLRWKDVLDQLEQAGFPQRTIKSVRNRHLRLRTEARLKVESKNKCNVCGLDQRGHVCGGLKGPNVEDQAE
jgi:hypothetical protein